MSCSDALRDGGTALPAAAAKTKSITDHRLFQLKPLMEMEVVGACRRGRRRGRRNRTAVERKSELEQRRRSKNARERQRVENVKNEYAKLQTLLGLDSGLYDKRREKRQHCKLRILTSAIQRLKTLKEILKRAEERKAAATVSTARQEQSLKGYGSSQSHEPYAPMPIAPNYYGSGRSSWSCCDELPLSRQPPDTAINQHLLTPYHLECQPQPPHYPLVPHPYCGVRYSNIPSSDHLWRSHYWDHWVPAITPYATQSSQVTPSPV